MTASKIQMDQIRSTSATDTGENIRAGSQKKSSLSQASGLHGASPDATCTCPSGDGSLRYKAELYDEVWALVTGKGYMNVTTAISVLESERDAALARVAELDKQCRDDVARALGLRPSQERGFAWSYLLASIKSCVKASEDAAQAQHSVPEGWYYDAPSQVEAVIIDIRGMWGEDDCPTYEDVAAALRRLLAAAPGKEVGHE
ncbi:hypothetical protein ACSETX_25655 [Pseudomonas aeruginosa]|uniref:hypothetical protein n=1 Tax=Pseudomonas aeruginosa TaxID=287 RepID=UPI0005BDD948|nr:hypothetical protein [Pseudomonas aeruginosa]AHA17471.2 hypothetical protein PA1S_06800 [Pseudomonas aeruginosa PA1]ALE47158.1 hypothetical protein AOD73_06795 [Pseudomonas aeruginosa]